ncbi:hypothetical protein [Streptomyces sp. NPDC046887]|uniref:hypothetical protein n=1 Tax=Streptomyces sp. NPDC046887 TaxID=3155472 RepID=UPI0033F52E44
MTEPKPPAPQTADQRHEQVEDYQQAFDTAAESVTKKVAAVQQLPFFGVFGGRTSFEDVPLNSMLDLLDSANPADLSEAGRRLQRVTEALNDAAKQLDGYVRATEWKGAGAEEFRRFGSELTTYTYGLGTFANAVGAQMEIAATGLTSVRNSVPPRDGRLVQKRPEDFPLIERGTDNPDYQKAVKVEKDRQEAINQMNRLASFYSVSETMLAAQEPPTLPKPLGAAVPPPSGLKNDEAAPSGGSTRHSNLAGRTPLEGGTVRITTTQSGDIPVQTDLTQARPIEAIGGGQRTEINSVGPLAPPAQPPTATQLPATGPAATGAVPPHMVGGVPPIRPAKAPPTAGGTSGVRRPGGIPGVNATGRPANAVGGGSARGGTAAGMAGRPAGASGSRGGSASATGRPGGPVGAHGVGNGSGAAGRAGMPGGAAQGPTAGRSGGAVAQGAGGRSSGGAFGARGSQGGIVGGTPQQRPTTGTGSRVPRGTVIGGESAAGGRTSTSRPMPGGVIGAQQAAGSSRSTGRGTASVNGVVGTPKGGPQPDSTAGGTRGNRRRGSKQNDRNEAARPDYLTEDEETWASRRRNIVPPVID